MELEILHAFDLLVRILTTSVVLKTEIIHVWKETFLKELTERYQNHWIPENPYQGNGYRSLTIFNGEVDPVIIKTAEEAGLDAKVIIEALPKELVIWIDPYMVSYKAGENGQIISHWEDYSRGKLAAIVKQRAANTVKVTLKIPAT